MKYLLSISIGPVQDFIATARRSRDLWFGSWLLSELSKAAAKVIYNRKGELIFPAIENANDLNPVEYDSSGNRVSGTDFAVVNKIVALTGEDSKGVCEEIDKAIKARLENIRIKAYDRLKKSRIDEAKARLQVADVPEFYWAACRVKDDLSDYAEARGAAESLLAARKNLREFVQPTAWSDYIPKSSLDGLRESVISEDAYNDLDIVQLRKQLGVREGERLCGVGLLKRHGNRQGDGSFFSTSHVAALPLLKRLMPDNRQAVEDYERALTELLDVITDKDKRDLLGFVPQRAQAAPHPVFGRNDGHILFEERLREFFTDDNKVRKAKEALRKLLKDVFGGERPKPYYALLHADGDRMGEAIDAQTTRKGHKDISAKLSEFAGEVGQIVEAEHDGSLVYSGGDDVLAFLPLHEALFCARKLADRFREKLKSFKTADGKSPTLSVGIAVGHHLDPLQDTLDLARQAEKAAKKQVKDKNALAIIVSKRSGADWLVKGSWRESATDEKALDSRLNYIIYLYLKEALPRGVGYELRDAALHLQGLDEALRKEALRVIKRKRTKEGKLKAEVFEKMESYLNDAGLSIDELAYQIIAARPFADAMKQAGVDAKGFAEKAGLKELEDTGGQQ